MVIRYLPFQQGLKPINIGFISGNVIVGEHLSSEQGIIFRVLFSDSCGYAYHNITQLQSLLHEWRYILHKCNIAS
jgi:hypothetical protein